MTVMRDGERDRAAAQPIPLDQAEPHVPRRVMALYDRQFQKIRALHFRESAAEGNVSDHLLRDDVVGQQPDDPCPPGFQFQIEARGREILHVHGREHPVGPVRAGVKERYAVLCDQNAPLIYPYHFKVLQIIHDREIRQPPRGDAPAAGQAVAFRYVQRPHRDCPDGVDPRGDEHAQVVVDVPLAAQTAHMAVIRTEDTAAHIRRRDCRRVRARVARGGALADVDVHSL